MRGEGRLGITKSLQFLVYPSLRFAELNQFIFRGVGGGGQKETKERSGTQGTKKKQEMGKITMAGPVSPLLPLPALPSSPCNVFNTCPSSSSR